MQNKETFGEYIRRLREESGLPIRKVAAHIDLDPSSLSKIERNERSATRNTIPKLAEIFEVEEKEVLTNYLSDKVAYNLMEQDDYSEVLKAAEEKIRYFRSKNVRQGSINF